MSSVTTKVGIELEVRMGKAEAEIKRLESQLAKTRTTAERASKSVQNVEKDVTKWGKSAMEVRGRIMGQVGAVLAAVVAVDKLAERSRKLAKEQGINAGLAFEWEKASRNLEDGIDKVVLAINNLPAAARTAAEELGILDAKTQDATESAEEGVSGWEAYAASLGALGLVALGAAKALGEVSDQINDMTPKRLSGATISAGILPLKKHAQQKAGEELVKVMERENENMKTSIEMLEANALANDIVTESLERQHKSRKKNVDIFKAERAAFGREMGKVEMSRAGASLRGAMDTRGSDEALKASMADAGRNLGKAEASQARDLARLKSEIALESIEEQKSLADINKLTTDERIELIDREKSARLDLLEAERKATTDKLELMRIDADASQVKHKAEIELVEERKRAIESEMTTRMHLADLNAQFTAQGVELASVAADGAIKSGRRREAIQKGLAGSELITIGIVESVKAIAAFAGFNYVEGAAHTIASITAFAKGGQLLAQAGRGGGGGGGGGTGLGAGMSFGGTETGGSVQSSSGGSDRPENRGPVSEESVQRSGRSGRPGPRRDRDSSDGPPLQIFYMGAPDAKFGDFARKAIKASERKSGNVNS